MDAALLLVDRRGVDGLSIRAVARVVGAPPMSLYTHFTNKEDLLDQMYEEISRRIHEDELNVTWQAELTALSRRSRLTLAAHTNWIDLMSRPTVPPRVPMRERVLRLMIDAGMSADSALKGISAVMLTSIGLILSHRVLNGPKGNQMAQKFDKIRAALDRAAPEDFAMTRMAESKVGHFDFDTQYEFTIRALIAGLERPAP